MGLPIATSPTAVSTKEEEQLRQMRINAELATEEAKISQLVRERQRARQSHPTKTRQQQYKQGRQAERIHGMVCVGSEKG